MAKNNVTLDAPEVNVEKKVMQKIMDNKVKIKHPVVLFIQKIWRYLVIFLILAIIISAGIFLVKEFF